MNFNMYIRHTLFNPQVYHVGVQETLSFTSYSFEKFDVTATVYYDSCGRSSDVVLHTAEESVITGIHVNEFIAEMEVNVNEL